MRKDSISPLLLLVLGLTLIPNWHSHGRAHSKTRPVQVAQTSPPHPPTHTVPFIDGAKTPEMVPDAVAYRMFLRMLMPPRNHPEALHIQESYIRHVLRAGAVLADPSHVDHVGEACDIHKKAEPRSSEVLRLQQFVKSYESRLRAIDLARRSLRQRGDIFGARALTADRDALVQEVIQAMPPALGAGTTKKLDHYVRLKFKGGTKIFVGTSAESTQAFALLR